MTRLRTYAPVMVWLLVAASCWAFGADGLHHHSLRVVQSPELGVEMEAGGLCPVDHFLQTMQGGDYQPDFSFDPILPQSEPAPLATATISTTEIFSAHSPRAPPFSS